MQRLLLMLQSNLVRGATTMLLALGALALAVTQSRSVTDLEAEASRAVHESTAQPITDWTTAITTFGGIETVLLVCLAAVALLAAARHWHGILALTLALAATQLAVHFAKVIFSRPRPDDAYALSEAAGFSFPSGHAATGMAVYATLTLLLARACGGLLRGALVVGGALLVLGIGASRVYLGVHYPTDVVAGWLLGALLVSLSWLVAARLRPAAPTAG